MPLSAQQIISLACATAKCPGFTSQGGQLLNMALQELCQDYDLDVARGLAGFTFFSSGVAGGGGGTGGGFSSGFSSGFDVGSSGSSGSMCQERVAVGR